jgi:hypothetical protein
MMTRPDLLSPDASDPVDSMEQGFGGLSASFLSLFSALTGNYDFSLLDGFKLQPFLAGLYLVYIVVNAIILLNLLIAVSLRPLAGLGWALSGVMVGGMGCRSWAIASTRCGSRRYRDGGEAQWGVRLSTTLTDADRLSWPVGGGRYERAQVLLEVEELYQTIQVLTFNRVRLLEENLDTAFLHVLRPAAHALGEDGSATGEEWAGRLKAMTQALKRTEQRLERL